jgi:hypothetical protein
MFEIIAPLLLRMGIGWLLWLVDRFTILVIVRRFPSMDLADYHSLRSKSYARMKDFVRRATYSPYSQSHGDVRRGFMQRLSVVLRGTLGSCLRLVLQEGGANDVTCLLSYATSIPSP